MGYRTADPSGQVNSLTAGPVLLGAAAAAEKKAAAGGATSGEDEEGEVWDPYNDNTESNVGGSSMNLGDAWMQASLGVYTSIFNIIYNMYRYIYIYSIIYCDRVTFQQTGVDVRREHEEFEIVQIYGRNHLQG